MTEAETFLSLYINQLKKKIEIIEKAYVTNYEINSSLLH